MKLLVLGHGRHGKGKVCEIIESLTGLKSLSSSEAAFPYILPTLKAARGYKSTSEVLAAKYNERPLWKESIKLFNHPSLEVLTDLILSKADVYDGMRDDDEYQANRRKFDWVIWVDARYRVPLEPSMKVEFNSREMQYLDNNGTEEELKEQVENLLDTLGLRD